MHDTEEGCFGGMGKTFKCCNRGQPLAAGAIVGIVLVSPKPFKLIG